MSAPTYTVAPDPHRPDALVILGPDGRVQSLLGRCADLARAALAIREQAAGVLIGPDGAVVAPRDGEAA